MNSKVYIALFSGIILLMTSCDKENSQAASEQQLSVSESVALEASVEAVDKVLDENILYSGVFLGYDALAGKGDAHHFGFFPDCVILQTETTENTITVTLSFQEGCEDRNGNALSGTLTIVKSLTDSSLERSINFEDFTVNGYVVNGTKTFSYTAANDNGNPQMAGTVDISVETESGTISRQGNSLVEITAGGETDTCLDDEITRTGSYTYTDASGATFSLEITTPLVKPAECRYIAMGIKTYTTEEGTATLDYGDGTCDNLALLTDMDGTATEIELHRGRWHH